MMIRYTPRLLFQFTELTGLFVGVAPLKSGPANERVQQ